MTEVRDAGFSRKRCGNADQTLKEEFECRQLFWERSSHRDSVTLTIMVSALPCNRPFYRYGGHIELIRFKDYYRMPRGHEHISFVFSSAFQDIFA